MQIQAFVRSLIYELCRCEGIKSRRENLMKILLPRWRTEELAIVVTFYNYVCLVTWLLGLVWDIIGLDENYFICESFGTCYVLS